MSGKRKFCFVFKWKQKINFYLESERDQKESKVRELTLKGHIESRGRTGNSKQPT